MDDNAIREKLAEKFRTHVLPRSMPNALHSSTLEGFEAMVEIDGGAGHRCCVCDEMITQTDEGAWQFRYPDRSYAFHQRCEQLWQEERHKPLPRSG